MKDKVQTMAVCFNIFGGEIGAHIKIEKRDPGQFSIGSAYGVIFYDLPVVNNRVDFSAKQRNKKYYFFQSLVKTVLKAETVEGFFAPQIQDLQDEISNYPHCDNSSIEFQIEQREDMIQSLKDNIDLRIVVNNTVIKWYITIDKGILEVFDDRGGVL